MDKRIHRESVANQSENAFNTLCERDHTPIGFCCGNLQGHHISSFADKTDCGLIGSQTRIGRMRWMGRSHVGERLFGWRALYGH